MTKFVLGKKAGMTQLFDESGIAIPATVIECNPMFVIQNKTVEKEGRNRRHSREACKQAGQGTVRKG